MPILDLNFYLNDETINIHAGKTLGDFLCKSSALENKSYYIELLRTMQIGIPQIQIEQAELDKLQSIFNNDSLLEGHPVIARFKQQYLDAINKAIKN
jgi:hypothetical protein